MDEPVQLYDTGASATTRLSQLGIGEQAQPILVEAIRAAWAGNAASVTAHDVASAIGLLMWMKGMRHLRDGLVPLGWTVARSHNFERVVHPARPGAIAVAVGTSGVGTAEPMRTRYPRGRALREEVAARQLQFWQTDPEAFPPSVPSTWLLVYHIDRTAEEIRVELSLPLNIDREGHVTSWRERILLDALPITTEPEAGTYHDDDDREAYEVPVSFRTG